MENSVPTPWWKMAAGCVALAVFNIFAYMHLDSARGPVVVWGPVKALYASFGPDRVMTVIGALAVLFLLGALVEKVRSRDINDDHYRRPRRQGEQRQSGPFRWVDVD